MMHEASLHEFNCFLTLTYDDLHVPQNYSLNKEDQQLFIKRLREHVARKYYQLKVLDIGPGREPARLRFYLAGEYGDLRGRPHYHAAIFGFDFPDKKLWKHNELGQPLYRSETLSVLWGKGDATTAHLDYGSASYIARYCTKKMVGSKADDHYYRLSPIDGAFHSVSPERAYMSIKPGLGALWAAQNHSDFRHDGFITTGGHFQPIPRYYEKYLSDQEKLKIKELNRKKRFAKAKAYGQENTDARRYVRAQVRDARIKSLKRTTSGE